MANPTFTSTYPSIETVMNLVRVYQNDWVNSGAGQITTDTSPQTLPALNSAIRELYRQLRNVGSPSLLRDNVLVALPANGATGPGVQTNLSQQGYFDGLTQLVSPTLPSDLLFPLQLWEQQTGTSIPFVPMSQPQAGLPSVMNQSSRLSVWEWRGGAGYTAGAGGGDALWFIGALVPVTIRIRYQAALTQFLSSAVFASTFIPIMDSEDVVAYKVAYKISSAISGETPPVLALKGNADAALSDLRNEIIRRAQEIDYQRQQYEPNYQSNYRNMNNLVS